MVAFPSLTVPPAAISFEIGWLNGTDSVPLNRRRRNRIVLLGIAKQSRPKLFKVSRAFATRVSLSELVPERDGAAVIFRSSDAQRPGSRGPRSPMWQAAWGSVPTIRSIFPKILIESANKT
jgi:hypothetical protein